MIQVRFPILVFVTITLAALFTVRGVMAQEIPSSPTQTEHSLQLTTAGFCIAQVEVDGTVQFRGILAPQETRTWRGGQITLTIEHNLPVTLLFDDSLPGTLTHTGKRTTVQWPQATLPTQQTTVPMPTGVATTDPNATVSTGALLTTTVQTRTGTAATRQTIPISTTSGVTDTVVLTTTAVAAHEPMLYTVQPDDTLFLIAQRFGTDVDTLLAANQIANVNLIYVGTTLRVPGSDGSLPLLPLTSNLIPINNGTIVQAAAVAVVPRKSITERLTTHAQAAPASSPFHQTTWLAYYGRPAVPVMGILGEFELDELTTLLKAEAAAYDAANSEELAVLPAYHLVYGMATKAPNDDNSHLIFLEDEVVKRYIERAEAEGFVVILDIQIGALTPAEALASGLPWLDYTNVHLALDPEFAMAHAGQLWPGDPIGYVTAAQINEAQALMQQYMAEHRIPGQRMLLIHQFLETMIENKSELDWTSYEQLVLTLSADGWGGPWGKISKYNSFMDAETRFTAFKLFYRWDEPLMTPREALGVDGYGEGAFIEVTPNLVIYQ